MITITDVLVHELVAAAFSARIECCGGAVATGVLYGGQHEMICCGLHAESEQDIADFNLKTNPDTILALLAERAELKRDAERYRWWRSYFEPGSSYMPDAVCSVSSPAELDAAIDAAMQAK